MARDRTYKSPTNTKKYQSTQEEIDQIREDAHNAKDLLDNPYLKTYLQNSQNSILQIHAAQLVNDTTETTETNGIKTAVIVPAKKEYAMLAGQYRFINQLLGDLEQTVLIGTELENKIKSEEIEVKVEDED